MQYRVTRKTKIVATIGPASRSRETIRNLILAGMNVARLNFSHGTAEEHQEVFDLLREESQSTGKPLAIFQDLCGPKVRIGDIEGGDAVLELGKEVELRHGSEKKEIGNSGALFVEAFDPVEVEERGVQLRAEP